MWRFILMTFVFLGWSFYELSDGADFEPQDRITTRVISIENTQPTANTIASAEIAPRAVDNTTTDTHTAIILPQTTTLAPVTMARLSVSEIGNSTLALEPEKTRLLTQRQASLTSVHNAAAIIQPPQKLKDIRAVRGNRVNMRGGPGTRYSVLAKLTKGMEVEILRTSGGGWVKLRVVDSGRVGWMSERLVTLAAN